MHSLFAAVAIPVTETSTIPAAPTSIAATFTAWTGWVLWKTKGKQFDSRLPIIFGKTTGLTSMKLMSKYMSGQPRSQGLSSLPPLVVGTETVVTWPAATRVSVPMTKGGREERPWEWGWCEGCPDVEPDIMRFLLRCVNVHKVSPSHKPQNPNYTVQINRALGIFGKLNLTMKLC